jgi:hypothetical protein
MSKINGRTKLIIHSDFAARNGDDPTFKTTLVQAGIDPWGRPLDSNPGRKDPEAEDVLEDIFRAFNRVTSEDCERLDAIGYKLPSLSVGDTVILDQKVYEVKNLGFEEIKQATV